MQLYTTDASARPDTKAKRGRKAKVSKAEARRVNNFRLHDIVALINGRHNGWCDDPEWLVRYFFAALPHLIVSKARWLDAVNAWVALHLPLLEAVKGQEWIETEARACQAKDHKCPKTDKLAQLLMVQENEVADFGLCTIPAASKPKPMRDAANQKRRNMAKQEKRAESPTHTPRKDSKAAKARAQGTTADALYSKARRERLKAEKAAQADQSERVSGPAHGTLDTAPDRRSDGVSGPTQDVGNDGVSGPTIPSAMRRGFGPHNNTNPRTTLTRWIRSTGPTKLSNENRAAA